MAAPAAPAESGAQGVTTERAPSAVMVEQGLFLPLITVGSAQHQGPRQVMVEPVALVPAATTAPNLTLRPFVKRRPPRVNVVE